MCIQHYILINTHIIILEKNNFLWLISLHIYIVSNIYYINIPKKKIWISVESFSNGKLINIYVFWNITLHFEILVVILYENSGLFANTNIIFSISLKSYFFTFYSLSCDLTKYQDIYPYNGKVIKWSNCR